MLAINYYVLRNRKLFFMTRFMSSAAKNAEILANHFGLPLDKAEYYVFRNKLGEKDSERLLTTIKFCKKIGLEDSEVLKVPKLIGRHPLIIENYYIALKEGGFHKITPKVLQRHVSHTRKPIIVLKSMGFIKTDTNVVDSFVNNLDPIPQSFTISQYDDTCLWTDIQFTVLKAYLQSQLEASTEDINNLLRTHPQIRRRSLQFIQENLKIAYELGFTNQKILNYGYMLHNYPPYARTLLAEYPDVAGCNMAHQMRMYPKLVMCSPRNFAKIYEILKDFNISDEAIRHRMNVFSLSPETVQSRLEEMAKTPKLRVLFHHPHVLKLVVHHNRALSRLTFLDKMQLRCAGCTILGHNHEYFDNHIKEGKDSLTFADANKFLRSTLRLNMDAVWKKWHRHPYSFQVPLLDMQHTFNYLRGEGYERQDISEAVLILLYSAEKIQTASINESYLKISKNISKVQKLNLLMYYIELEHHFTGNGIWQDEFAHNYEIKAIE